MVDNSLLRRGDILGETRACLESQEETGRERKQFHGSLPLEARETKSGTGRGVGCGHRRGPSPLSLEGHEDNHEI